MITRFEQLVERASDVGPLRVAVILPHTEASLRCIVQANLHGMAQCTLVGDVTAIRTLGSEKGIDLTTTPLVDEQNQASAVRRAVDLCREGHADVLVNDGAPLRLLFPAILDSRPRGALLSGISACALSAQGALRAQRLLLLTDGIMVVSPDLEQRIALVENAIGVAHKLGLALPHVALVAATETINLKDPTSTQAAQITMMARRGQIKDAIVDGPLGFDNAISAHAAQVKGIASDVSGKVDILVAPDLAAGNLLLRTLSTLCRVPVVNVVVGGRTPLVLWSPTDDVPARTAGLALGILCA